MREDRELTVVALFAGVFSEAFRQKVFDAIFGLDNGDPSTDTLEMNYSQ